MPNSTDQMDRFPLQGLQQESAQRTTAGHHPDTGVAGTTPGSSPENPLKDEYEQVGDNFRKLTDIRFKLIGLLPSAAAVVGLIKTDDVSGGGFPFAIFGLVVTLCIISYNKRNDQLYDALVGRAATIERELGLPHGAFAQRPTSWLELGFWPLTWPINHRRPVFLIYLATVSFWLYLAMASVFMPTGYSENLVDWLEPAIGVNIVTLHDVIARTILAVVAVLITAIAADRFIKREHRRKKIIEGAAIAAFGLARKAINCAEVAHGKDDAANVFAGLSENERNSLVLKCAEMKAPLPWGEKRLHEAIKKVLKSADFYGGRTWRNTLSWRTVTGLQPVSWHCCRTYPPAGFSTRAQDAGLAP
jgi:hypothetical protein